eukprot:CAMPEP_0203856678 /NCGR_PEP_ID=MMETSP0359-20131031/10314_1 /ASSEMBLY_ACC=CAM_ASM_000338 /TAXON_ID=268821 /ORGANISM="Scrippsiella Hangoei, Strain SHTV-5" /LENGTH=167 /DNA_ID=CAMNT_0050773315 /DNA_START=379 /DNA_END=880 /DNA_ORIENTATION=+
MRQVQQHADYEERASHDHASAADPQPHDAAAVLRSFQQVEGVAMLAKLSALSVSLENAGLPFCANACDCKPAARHALSASLENADISLREDAGDCGSAARSLLGPNMAVPVPDEWPASAPLDESESCKPSVVIPEGEIPTQLSRASTTSVNGCKTQVMALGKGKGAN